MDRLKELQDKLTNLEAEAKALIEKDDATAEEIEAKQKEITATKAKIKVQQQIADDEATKAQENKPVNEPLYAQPKDHNLKKWKNGFGEFLGAV